MPVGCQPPHRFLSRFGSPNHFTLFPQPLQPQSPPALSLCPLPPPEAKNLILRHRQCTESLHSTMKSCLNPNIRPDAKPRTVALVRRYYCQKRSWCGPQRTGQRTVRSVERPSWLYLGTTIWIITRTTSINYQDTCSAFRTRNPRMILAQTLLFSFFSMFSLRFRLAFLTW